MTRTSIARWARLARAFAIALAILSVANGASAQQAPAGDWQHGTLLTGFLGAQSASSDLNGGAGLGLGWEMTRRLAFEGRATWFPVNNDGPSDFAATLTANVPLMAARRVAPFVTAGAGMYRATFNSSSSEIPEFYRLRMPDGPGTHTFQDFLVTMGGGVNVFVGRHVAIRPDVSLMLVTTTSDVRPVGTMGVQFVYHFEPHPVE
jgi:Outer membrane protein beta-barrel domain